MDDLPGSKCCQIIDRLQFLDDFLTATLDIVCYTLTRRRNAQREREYRHTTYTDQHLKPSSYVDPPPSGANKDESLEWKARLVGCLWCSENFRLGYHIRREPLVTTEALSAEDLLLTFHPPYFLRLS